MQRFSKVSQQCVSEQWYNSLSFWAPSLLLTVLPVSSTIIGKDQQFCHPKFPQTKRREDIVPIWGSGVRCNRNLQLPVVSTTSFRELVSSDSI
eukprot:5745643-Amphidinium_carterae.1